MGGHGMHTYSYGRHCVHSHQSLACHSRVRTVRGSTLSSRGPSTTHSSSARMRISSCGTGPRVRRGATAAAVHSSLSLSLSLSLGQDALQWYDEISMGFSDAAAPGFGTPSFDEAKVPSVPSSRHRGTRALAQAGASHSVCRVHSWRRLSWKAVQRDGR